MGDIARECQQARVPPVGDVTRTEARAATGWKHYENRSKDATGRRRCKKQGRQQARQQGNRNKDGSKDGGKGRDKDGNKTNNKGTEQGRKQDQKQEPPPSRAVVAIVAGVGPLVGGG